MRIGQLDTDERVLIVAEIGNNHEGSYRLAEELIGLAAEAGADAVKLQTIVPEKLVSALQAERIRQLKKFQLSYDEFERLSRVAGEHRVLFLSTPFDLDSARFLAPLVPAFKIASGDNNFFPLIEVLARSGKPIIMSAGLADLAEVRRSADFIRDIWGESGVDPGLAILHCVASYPTRPEDANLRAIKQLQELGVTVGYSDHTLGIEAAVVGLLLVGLAVEAAVLSVGLGARIIEKHFTKAKDHSEFHDHRLSADPAELAALVRGVRQAEVMLGQGPKRLLQSERAVLAAARRSIVAARDLEPGTVLTSGDLTWVRPGGGLAPGREREVLGRTLTKPLREGTMILPEDLA